MQKPDRRPAVPPLYVLLRNPCFLRLLDGFRRIGGQEMVELDEICLSPSLPAVLPPISPPPPAAPELFLGLLL